MRAGLLKDRGTLQKIDPEAQDDFGQPMEGWVDVAAIWMQILYLNGKETIAAGKETATVSASVRIRKRDVQPNMRILYGTDVMNIKAVLPGPRGDYLDLVVEVSAVPA